MKDPDMSNEMELSTCDSDNCAVRYGCLFFPVESATFFQLNRHATSLIADARVA